MKDTIRLSSSMRIVIEVLDNGSVIVTLEQSVSRSSLSDRTWQPVNFKSYGNRNGYKVKAPNPINKLLGDTLEKRVRNAISRCRTAAAKLASVQLTMSQLIPKNDQEASTLEDLVHLMAREIYQRLKRNLPAGDRNLNETQRLDVSLILQSVVDHVNNISNDPRTTENLRTSRGGRTSLVGGGYLGRISVEEAPPEVRAVMDQILHDLLGLEEIPIPNEVPIEAPVEEVRRERIDDLIVHNDDPPVPSEESENETTPIEEDSKK